MKLFRNPKIGLLLCCCALVIGAVPISSAQAATARAAGSADLSRWADSAGNQGVYTACVSWSVTQLADWWANRLGIKKKNSWGFAPRSTWSLSGKTKDLTFAFSTLTTRGIIPKSQYPDPVGQKYFNDYVKKHNGKKPKSLEMQFSPVSKGQARVAARYRFRRGIQLFNHINRGLYPAPNTGEIAKLNRELRSGRPVIIGILQYDSLNNWYSNTARRAHGFYERPEKTDSRKTGRHAMLVLGYNSKGLLAQNTYSTDWGVNGYVRIGWKTVYRDVFQAISAECLGAYTSKNRNVRCRY